MPAILSPSSSEASASRSSMACCSAIVNCSLPAGALALHVNAYLAGAASNVLNIMTFVGGGNENLICAAIASAAGFIVSFAVAWFFGFSEDELENGPISER